MCGWRRCGDVTAVILMSTVVIWWWKSGSKLLLRLSQIAMDVAGAAVDVDVPAFDHFPQSIRVLLDPENHRQSCKIHDVGIVTFSSLEKETVCVNDG